MFSEHDDDGTWDTKNDRVSGVLNAPIHLDILRGVYDLAEICPVVELQAVCKSGKITPVQQRKANQISETFWNILEENFSTPTSSPSKDLALLVHIYIVYHSSTKTNISFRRSIFPSRKTSHTTLKVAYSLFDRREKKFLMAKEFSAFDFSRLDSSDNDSSTFSTCGNKDEIGLDHAAKQQAQRIVDELSFVLLKKLEKSQSPFFGELD